MKLEEILSRFLKKKYPGAYPPGADASMEAVLEKIGKLLDLSRVADSRLDDLYNALIYENSTPSALCTSFNLKIIDTLIVTYPSPLAPYSKSTDTVFDQEFDKLQRHALSVLENIIRDFGAIPDSKEKGLLDIDQLVAAHIAHITHEKSTNPATLKTLDDRLAILQDYDKIKKMKIIQVPQSNGKSKRYCILEESAGGVTKKDSLVLLEKVKAKFALFTKEAYLDKRSDVFKFNIDAIIKHPKKGNLTEVQHEAVALQISRCLGHTTTDAVILMHDKEPCLFVPFDKISKMSEFAKGKTIAKGKLSRGKKSTYEDHSTILPIGEGLQANQFIGDFGNTLGLFYLCSDTDAFGGENQNKAMLGRLFYIFDQVVMLEDNFELTTALTLSAINPLSKVPLNDVARHFIGRNKSLIEDSSLGAKLDGIFQLLHHRDVILNILNQLIATHQAHIAHGPKDKNSELLLKDAIKLRDKIENRLNPENIFKHFPKIKSGKQSSRHPTTVELKNSLSLLKLINAPVLFTDDGRPYKYPWTTRDTFKLESLQRDSDHNETFTLLFNANIPKEILFFLDRAGIEYTLGEKSITLTRGNLLSINDSIMFPEYRSDIDVRLTYLDVPKLSELNFIKNSYTKLSEADQKLWQELMLALRNLEKFTHPSQKNNKIDYLLELSKLIESQCSNAANKGPFMHLQKKFQCYIIQQLHDMLPTKALKLRARLIEAFDVAVSLDRVKIFNQVVMAAIKNSDYQALIGYLEQCKSLALPPATSGHISAKVQSERMQELSQTMLATLTATTPRPPGGSYHSLLVKYDFKQVVAVAPSLQEMFSQSHEILKSLESEINNGKPKVSNLKNIEIFEKLGKLLSTLGYYQSDFAQGYHYTPPPAGTTSLASLIAIDDQANLNELTNIHLRALRLWDTLKLEIDKSPATAETPTPTPTPAPASTPAPN